MEDKEELEEGSQYAEGIDLLDEKVKAQVRIWRIDGVPARTCVKRLKSQFGISVHESTIWNWLASEKFRAKRKNVAQSLLEQIHLLRMKIDNSLVLEIPPAKLRQYLDTLEVYARVYKEIPKQGAPRSQPKNAKDLYESLG